MLNITATIDGAPISLDSRNDLEAFYRFIGIYLRFTSQPSTTQQPNSLPTVPTPAQETRKAEQEPTQVKHRPFEGRNPPDGQRIVDYITKILEENPYGLTSVQLTNKMIEAGWKTSSVNPMRLVQIKLYEDKERFCQFNGNKWRLCKFTSNGETEKTATNDFLTPVFSALFIPETGKKDLAP